MAKIDYDKCCRVCAHSVWIVGELNQMKCRITDKIIKNQLAFCDKFVDAFKKEWKDE